MCEGLSRLCPRPLRTKGRIKTSLLNPASARQERVEAPEREGESRQGELGAVNGARAVTEIHRSALSRSSCPVSSRLTRHRPATGHHYSKKIIIIIIKIIQTKAGAALGKRQDPQLLFREHDGRAFCRGNNFPVFWHRKSVLGALHMPRQVAKPSSAGSRRNGNTGMLNPFWADAGAALPAGHGRGEPCAPATARGSASSSSNGELKSS